MGRGQPEMAEGASFFLLPLLRRSDQFAFLLPPCNFPAKLTAASWLSFGREMLVEWRGRSEGETQSDCREEGGSTGKGLLTQMPASLSQRGRGQQSMQREAISWYLTMCPEKIRHFALLMKELPSGEPFKAYSLSYTKCLVLCQKPYHHQE